MSRRGCFQSHAMFFQSGASLSLSNSLLIPTPHTVLTRPVLAPQDSWISSPDLIPLLLPDSPSDEWSEPALHIRATAELRKADKDGVRGASNASQETSDLQS